ncbi:MAG: DUF1801 domain-containing protein [Cyclobacteriaceae bacterium]|nr:DUF1801 domain-containing protein [Cyclobacteriaceae bacterium]MDW8331762.1 DUF1801 domain-containing protein [Cyclobacteriaceae bacterium]
MNTLNKEVSRFLDELKHPLRKEIDLLRGIILSSVKGLEENIKWNAPNYNFGGQDRITLKIMPPKQIQIIFHRGAARQKQPASRLIANETTLLNWKENDRAVATFKSVREINEHEKELVSLVKSWIKASV